MKFLGEDSQIAIIISILLGCPVGQLHQKVPVRNNSVFDNYHEIELGVLDIQMLAYLGILMQPVFLELLSNPSFEIVLQ